MIRLQQSTDSCRAALGIRDLRRMAACFLGLLIAWGERMRERQQLATMDDRSLKDMGISRCDAEQEADKPFWRS